MNYCYSTHLHGLTTSSVVSTNKLYILYVVLHKTQRKCPVFADDGTGPDKMAHIMGPPDCCDNAAQIIQELLQSIRVREEGGQGVHTSHTHVEYLEKQPLLTRQLGTVYIQVYWSCHDAMPCGTCNTQCI